MTGVQTCALPISADQLDGAPGHRQRLPEVVGDDGQDIGGTPSFAPGDTRSVRLRLQPGTYELLCTVGDHAQLGMKGELTVR